MSNSFKVLINSNNEAEWSVPAPLMKELGLAVGEEVVLQCGAKTAPAQVQPRQSSGGQNPADRETRVMEITRPIALKLGVPEEAALFAQAELSGKIRLGPVIGILTFAGHIPDRLGYYRRYAELNRGKGILYVFRGQDMDQHSQTILGYYFSHQDRVWHQNRFPFPDAVIDRCYPNPYKHHVLLEEVLGPGRIFNKKSMITKLDFAEALANHPDLASILPATNEFTNPRQLIDFLDRFKEVYLKPLNAMKGLGVVSAKFASGGKILCYYMDKGQKITEAISDPGEIDKILKKAAGQVRPYVIQQGIERLTFRGAPFAFRSWAMKNGGGRWVLPGMFAKAAEGDSFLTNFSAGAKMVPLKVLFSDILPNVPHSGEQLVSLVEHLTLKIAPLLDEHFGPLGELGFDFVLDVQGQPWLLEVNGNPGREPVFLQQEYPDWSSSLYVYPFQYAARLAGFGHHLRT